MDVNPELLQSLVDLDLYNAGWLGPVSYPGEPVKQFAMSSLSASLVKKFHNDECVASRDDAALALFIECNRKCKDYSFPVPASDLEAVVDGEVKSFLYDFYTPNEWLTGRDPHLLNLGAIAARFDVGPGSSTGAVGEDFYSKLANSTLTYTDELLVYFFQRAVCYLGLWLEVEADRAAVHGYRAVEASNISFAVKKRIISRLICREASLDMIFQKAIGKLHEERLLQVSGIDLSLQPARNAKLAFAGSKHGRFGTIDLSSASDTISVNLLREILPRQSLNWLLRTRARRARAPNGDLIELHMLSTMGNGYTFPLQTTIFCAIVHACYRALDIEIRMPYGTPDRESWSNGNYGVFGDDIVVDTRAYKLVCSTLSRYGFTVNVSKSFNEGLFRESCGYDYYCGHNVRGVYFQRLHDDTDLFSCINRLNRWSALHGVALPQLVTYLHGLLSRQSKNLTVPWDEADTAGLKVPLSMHHGSRGPVGSVRYRYLKVIPLIAPIPWVQTDEPDVDYWPKTLISQLRRLMRLRPRFSYKPAAALLTAIAGRLNAGSIGLRSRTRRAVLRQRFVPGWDETAAAMGVSPRFYEDWKVFVAKNLDS